MSKRILFVLMPENFQDHEFHVPHIMLTKKGYTVDIAGFKPGIATGMFGMQVTPSLVLEQVTPDDFDAYHALVIPGGNGSTTYLWHSKKLQEVINYFHANKKIVATICYACMAPAQAGILTGKSATIYPTDEAKELFKEHGVSFVDQGVVSLADDKIITAQGPTFSKAFGSAIIEMLKK